MENKYKPLWEVLEKEKPQPTHANKIYEIEFEEFAAKVYEQEPLFVNSIVESLYQGDAYFLKRAFSPQIMSQWRHQAFEYGKTRPSSFHKMLEGCPDFHRIIFDPEVVKKYAFQGFKHSYYFFPWNEDPLNVFPEVYKRWRVFKFLGGFLRDVYEKNTPKDGVVDRFQIVRYPAGLGSLETHSDPYKHQRTIISGFMSKRGVDYETGGFYMIGPNDKKIDMESHIDIGDMQISYATVLHGVTIIDAHKKVDTDTMEGRWWFGYYSNSSDEVAHRHTGHAVQVGAGN